MNKYPIAWVEGRYALGWRGWLAEKLLSPIVNEVLLEETKI